MIKIQNNIATREPIPAFLTGLAPESLADLSWTDPALGVSDAAWWPEEDQSPALAEYQRYGAETLIPDAERKVVTVVRAVEPWSPEEITAAKAAKAVADREAAKQAREKAVGEIKVTTAAGHTFDGDEVSQGRMARAITVLSTGYAATVPWVLADNTVIQADIAELTEALALSGAAQAALWVI